MRFCLLLWWINSGIELVTKYVNVFRRRLGPWKIRNMHKKNDQIKFLPKVSRNLERQMTFEFLS